MARTWSAILWLTALTNSVSASPARICNASYSTYDDKVPNSYLVGFNKANYSLADHLKTIGTTFKGSEYTQGYYATLTADQLAKVRSDCNVKRVADNIYGSGDSDSTLVQRADQKDAPWPLYYSSSTEKKPQDHVYHSLDDAGKGVDIYVLDSGINHLDEFKTNGVDRVIDFYTGEQGQYDDIPGPKGYGHGTPVASAIAGNQYGIAKFANILNCMVYGRQNVRPELAYLVQAIDAAVARHNQRKGDGDFKGSVINMSLGFRKLLPQLDEALEKAHNAGISLVASAGNRRYQTVYPAQHKRVIAVGAINEDYTPWWPRDDGDVKGTNYGKDHVTIFAPGGDVPTLGMDNRKAVTSGSSGAAGYVSGAIAIFWSTEGKNLGVDTARARLLKNADSDYINFFAGVDWKDSPNLLLNAGFSKGAAQKPPVKYLDGPETDSSSPKKPDNPPPAPLPKDENKCHGVGGDYWVMSRDVAVDNAKAFCKQTEKEQTYNQGSVNELKLSVRNLKDDSKGPSSAPDCVGRFQNGVIDGCDGNNAVHNPHNYKFGSTLVTGDGWEYKMEPKSKQVNEVACDISYKFLWNNVEIRGKNLPDGMFGANGEGLRNQLSRCGALTYWNFERTPNDVKFQWYASCRLPIGTKNCVGNALQAAGGSGRGGCWGAGKRSEYTGRPYGIEDWPGYGDDSRHVFTHPAESKRDSIDDWPGYGDDSRHVFTHPAESKRDNIDDWPGYGDDSRHVFQHTAAMN